MAWLIMVICSVLGLLTVPTLCCIREYHELEQSVLRNPHNLDSLVRAFFPPNQEQAILVEVFYDREESTNSTYKLELLKFMLSNSCGNEPEFCKHLDEGRTNCTYLYRWSSSPIYLFIEPRLLNDMSLNILPGTEIRIRQAKLVMPEICNSKEDQITDTNGDVWDLPVFLLTQLTTAVSNIKLITTRFLCI